MAAHRGGGKDVRVVALLDARSYHGLSTMSPLSGIEILVDTLPSYHKEQRTAWQLSRFGHTG